MTLKIILISGALLFLTAVCCAAEKAGAYATFPEIVHDLGAIHEDGGEVSCEFEFTNTGDKSLVIISAQASCGCTTPEFPQQPIKPGMSEKIKVTYNPLGRPGAFKKEIKIITNGKKKKETLYIIGNVIPKKK